MKTNYTPIQTTTSTSGTLTPEAICTLVRSLHPGQPPISLHRPVFSAVEKAYLSKCIDSNFVSSLGAYVDEFERRLAELAGVHRAVATVNGTAALHLSLLSLGVTADTEVITQPITFAATTNAIGYLGAVPHFVDVERQTMGMSPEALEAYLTEKTEIRHGACHNRDTGRRISACLPVHVYGHPCRMEEIAELCRRYRIPLVEDAAEALGSYRGGVHVGRHGVVSTLSFNGNKIITTGGGGAVLTNDRALADRIKHLSTTAKTPHPWEYFHDELGYNYRLPNLNAALGCAQLEQLPWFLEEKRKLAGAYEEFFSGSDIEFVREPEGCRSNYWLNAVLFPDRGRRDDFLAYSNSNGVMTRPLWTLMTDLPAFAEAPCEAIPVARDLVERVVALPSGVPGPAYVQIPGGGTK